MPLHSESTANTVHAQACSGAGEGLPPATAPGGAPELPTLPSTPSQPPSEGLPQLPQAPSAPPPAPFPKPSTPGTPDMRCHLQNGGVLYILAPHALWILSPTDLLQLWQSKARWSSQQRVRTWLRQGGHSLKLVLASNASTADIACNITLPLPDRRVCRGARPAVPAAAASAVSVVPSAGRLGLPVAGHPSRQPAGTGHAN